MTGWGSCAAIEKGRGGVDTGCEDWLIRTGVLGICTSARREVDDILDAGQPRRNSWEPRDVPHGSIMG